jgi:predicted ABC-type ATPase
MLRARGGHYFNPDEATRAIAAQNPAMDAGQANTLAWQLSVAKLREAVATKTSYTFETTLGGQTVTGLLLEAAAAGITLSIWYCGLESVDLHMRRIAARVAAGGHDIPAAKVRERFDASRSNLLRLIPIADDLAIYDNSADAQPNPEPRPLLRLHQGVLRFPIDGETFARTPGWAQPLLAAAVGAARELPVFLR